MNSKKLEKEVTKIECMTCGWIGNDDEMEAINSDMEPGCPSCWGNDFMEVEDEEE